MGTIQIKFFATLRDVVGSREIRYPMPEPLPLITLLKKLSLKYGTDFQKYVLDKTGTEPRELLQFVVNGKNMLDFKKTVKAGDILAILPPIGGG